MKGIEIIPLISYCIYRLIVLKWLIVEERDGENIIQEEGR